MLGAAVLGLGRIGPTHAGVVAASAGAELKAVADSDEAKLGALLELWDQYAEPSRWVCQLQTYNRPSR